MTRTRANPRACWLAVLASFCTLNLYAEEQQTPNEKTFVEVIRPLLQKHCVRCHGENKPKAGLRVDRLGADMFKEKSAAVWHEIADRVNLGAMPPKNEPALQRRADRPDTARSAGGPGSFPCCSLTPKVRSPDCSATCSTRIVAGGRTGCRQPAKN